MQKRIGLIFLLGLMLSPFLSFSQDSISDVVSSDEKNSIKFQEYFFKALSEKSINHYKKAIENLEECNQIIPKNIAVLFELSKNYYYLNSTFEAVEFAKKALQIEPKNSWILEHLVTVYKRQQNFKDAIIIQQKIIQIYPKKKGQLVFLYIQDRNISKAKKLLQQMEDENFLSARLQRIKKSFEEIKEVKKEKHQEKASDNFSNLEKEFASNKSFTILQKILKNSKKNNLVALLKYSKIGLTLFPAQPYVYLMNGKALNLKKHYKEALETLQNGIDFVIDNKKLKAKFYLEMAVSYKMLGKMKQAIKYKKKVILMNK